MHSSPEGRCFLTDVHSSSLFLEQEASHPAALTMLQPLHSPPTCATHGSAQQVHTFLSGGGHCGKDNEWLTKQKWPRHAEGALLQREGELKIIYQRINPEINAVIFPLTSSLLLAG